MSDSDPNPDHPKRDPRLEIPPELREPVRRPEPPGTLDEGSMVSTARAWAVAFDFIFTILAGGILGWLVDHWRHANGPGLLLGLGLGFVVAFIRIIRHTQREEREDARRRADKPGNRPPRA